MSNLRITGAKAESETMFVTVSDGRVFDVDLTSMLPLRNATVASRGYWQIAADGQELRWPNVGVTVSLAGLLRGAES